MKKSRWFTAAEKPVRQGVYARQMCQGRNDFYYSRWDGKVWHHSATTTIGASMMENVSHNQDDFYWRGLAEKP